MKSKLYVAIDISADNLIDELEKIGARLIDKNRIIIPVEHLKEAEKIIGKSIIINEEEIQYILKKVEGVNEQVIVGDTKQKSQFGFEADIKYHHNNYVLTIPRTGQELRVPKEVVDTYIKVISLLKKKGIKIIKKRDLVSMVFREIGLYKVYEKNGDFYWEAFYGDRKNYHVYYYGPIKIIESWKLIEVLPSDKIMIH
ncbi:MAG: hypothetical protein GU361_04655 [Desulfurococcales archaeon]|jgi:hypothetical protein|nr:hypothetical protein [Desulfurococcales archaeon]